MNAETSVMPKGAAKGVKENFVLDEGFMVWTWQVCMKVRKLTLLEAWLKVWWRAQIKGEGRNTFISRLSNGGYK